MDTSRANPSYIRTFNALQIIGAIAFGLTTISAFVVQRRTQSRHTTWFSFCFSWIIFCISYILLVIAHQQTRPSHNLCIAQSALVYAATPLTGATTLSVCTHLLLNILTAVSIIPAGRTLSKVMILLSVMPWVLWIVIVIITLMFGIQHPTSVQLSPNGMYCNLKGANIAQLTSISAICAGVILIIEEGVILSFLYRYREALTGLGKSVTMAARVGVFTVTASVATGVGLLWTFASRVEGQFELLISAIPISTVIIFGTQRDLLQVWLFWKTRETQKESPEITPGGSVAFSTIVSGGSVPSGPHTTHDQQEQV